LEWVRLSIRCSPSGVLCKRFTSVIAHTSRRRLAHDLAAATNARLERQAVHPYAGLTPGSAAAMSVQGHEHASRLPQWHGESASVTRRNRCDARDFGMGSAAKFVGSIAISMRAQSRMRGEPTRRIEHHHPRLAGVALSPPRCPCGPGTRGMHPWPGPRASLRS
jgi:hypothetical protein